MSSKTVSDSVNELGIYTQTLQEHLRKELSSMLSDLDGVVGGNKIVGDSTMRGQLSPIDSNYVNIVVKVFNVS